MGNGTIPSYLDLKISYFILARLLSSLFSGHLLGDINGEPDSRGPFDRHVDIDRYHFHFLRFWSHHLVPPFSGPFPGRGSLSGPPCFRGDCLRMVLIGLRFEVIDSISPFLSCGAGTASPNHHPPLRRPAFGYGASIPYRARSLTPSPEWPPGPNFSKGKDPTRIYFPLPS